MNFLFHWKHKNLLLFATGLFLAWFLSQNKWFHGFIIGLGSYGYLSAILAGALFVSTFTIATGALILMTLSQTLSPIELIFLASFGAVLGDLLIFRFVKDEVEEEVEPIYDKISGSHLKKILNTKYFAWTLPVLGAFIILSPLPDELGVSLLGVSKMKTYQFLFVSWVSHTVGMSLLVYASTLA